MARWLAGRSLVRAALVIALTAEIVVHHMEFIIGICIQLTCGGQCPASGHANAGRCDSRAVFLFPAPSRSLVRHREPVRVSLASAVPKWPGKLGLPHWRAGPETRRRSPSHASAGFVLDAGPLVLRTVLRTVPYYHILYSVCGTVCGTVPYHTPY